MNRIKELRLSAGLQQKDIAISLGIKQAAISQWEHQKSDPKPEYIPKLAVLFNVPPEMIVYPSQTSLSDLEIDAIIRRAQNYSENPDDETWQIRERLRRDPSYRLLFDAASTATPEHLRAAAAMLKALEGTKIE